MKIGSLFSGIGGLDLGLERGLAEFGAETVWQIENNEYCCSVLEKNFPNSKVICDDIRNVDFSKLEPVDILVGGFPCQTFSYAGARRGMSEEDDRGLLWYEFERAISELKPRWVVGENVRGLLTAKDSEGNKGGAFARVVSFLSSRGYSVEWQVISAASVGSSHLRERIFIVGNTEHYGPFGTENRESIGKRTISRRQTEEILEKINRQLTRKSETLEHTESFAGIKADKQTSTKREKGKTWVDSGTGHGRTEPFISWQETKQQVGFFTYGISKGLAGKVGLPAYWLYNSDIDGTLWATPTATQIERSNLKVSETNPNRFVHKDGKTYPMNLTELVKTREESGPEESNYAIQPWEIVPRTAEDEVDRVNKIKALGNAVVPACAELVGRLISRSIKEETVVFDQRLA